MTPKSSFSEVNNLFIAINQIVYMKQVLSERELLFTRAQKLIVSERLKHSLEDIELKQERLSLSRVSSQSAKSKTDRKITSSIDVRDVSPKVKLLHEISDKLKSSKRLLYQTPDRSPKPQILSSGQKVIWSSELKQKSKGSKLQSMLKDIKRCNQMSTKAVSSIKKPLKNGQEWTNSYFKSQAIQIDKAQPRLGGMFNQLLALKEELKKVKQENSLLLKLVKAKQIQLPLHQDKNSGCLLCGCTCRQSPKQNQPIANSRPWKLVNDASMR